MESAQNLKQRVRDESIVSGDNTAKDVISTDDNDNKKSSRAKKTVMARGGLRSLIIAVALPLSLTLATISCFGSTSNYDAIPNKPVWYPPLWALHLATLTSSLLMGLSAWLVWAEGGFHHHPIALYLYLAQILLALSWDPIIFVFGDTLIGLILCMTLVGTLVGCSQSFRGVNPIAGALVIPCLAWVTFMAVVNFKLLYL